MLRSLHGGISCLLIALFLAGNVGEAAGLHECPHHDAASSAAGHRPGSHGDPSGSHEDDAARGACTCIGTCHGAASIGLPAGATAAAIVPDGVGSATGASTVSADPRSIPYLLPYATGPPSV
ncbi:MAG: hypothetical protein ACREMD_04405 [Gemmatimonadota bacterium]